MQEQWYSTASLYTGLWVMYQAVCAWRGCTGQGFYNVSLYPGCEGNNRHATIVYIESQRNI